MTQTDTSFGTGDPVIGESLPGTEQKVSLTRVTLLGLSGQQLGPSAAIAAGSMPLYAGNASWLAMALALLAALCMTAAVNVFARKYVVTGSLLSYVGISLGRVPQRVVAASYLVGFLVVCAALSACFVTFSSSFLHSLGVKFALSGWFQAATAIVISILAGVLTWRGLDASISITAWLSFLPVPLLAIVTVMAASKTGIDLQAQLTLQGTSLSSLAEGTIVALAYFVGCDALAALAAETDDPKKNVPLLLRNVLLITGLAFVAILVLSAPLMGQNLEALSNGESPTQILVTAAGMEFLQLPIDFLLGAATFASLVAFMNYGSRVFATASVDRFIPQIFSRIHPRFGSPTGSTVLMTLAAACIPVALQFLAATPPLQSTAYLSTLYSLFWIAPYVLLGFGAIREIRIDGHSRPGTVVAIGLGVAVFIALLIYNFAANPGGVFGALPYIMVLLTVLAFLGFSVVDAVRK
ncbi:APC family permease [Pseudomonas brassicacearum]|uniref:APC family permease n=1 Tax=Pseudomonas brassicacearum TaxID=930166 RepID=UPI0009B60480|nr:APC family permease [Pseudomonas brassicacearum]